MGSGVSQGPGLSHATVIYFLLVMKLAPFLLEHYEPNVKTVFKRNPDYFLKDQPYVDGVEWLVLNDPSAALAMYRTGQLDCGPAAQWSVRQQDLDALKQSHPHLV